MGNFAMTITHDTKKLMKKRDKLYKTMNKSGNKQQGDKYKKIKHQVQKQLHQLKFVFARKNVCLPNVTISLKKFFITNPLILEEQNFKIIGT
jgi:ElaB/YqjD/DUF883 family membrane-anchored ribosome-binding protein